VTRTLRAVLDENYLEHLDDDILDALDLEVTQTVEVGSESFRFTSCTESMQDGERIEVHVLADGRFLVVDDEAGELLTLVEGRPLDEVVADAVGSFDFGDLAEVSSIEPYDHWHEFYVTDRPTRYFAQVPE